MASRNGIEGIEMVATKLGSSASSTSGCYGQQSMEVCVGLGLMMMMLCEAWYSGFCEGDSQPHFPQQISRPAIKIANKICRGCDLTARGRR